MNRTGCIFCFGSVENSPVEHILPESLGGKEWACIKSDIVCGTCNNYFGLKVEEPALGSFPFLPFRLFLDIPTKKNHPPKMNTYLGTIKSNPLIGFFGIDPISSEIEDGINNGLINELRLLLEPTEPTAVCRLLLKMGLEVIASDNLADAYNQKFDKVRTFARAPSRGDSWWFLIHTDHSKLFEKFQKGLKVQEWVKNVKLEVDNIEGAEVFHLKLLDLSLITPMEERIIPAFESDLYKPDYQFYRVVI